MKTHKINPIDLHPKLTEKRGEYHLNEVFPSSNLAIAATTSLRKTIAKKVGKKILNVYYSRENGYVGKARGICILFGQGGHKSDE